MAEKKEQLSRKKESAWLHLDEKMKKAVEILAGRYMDFLTTCKTERLCIDHIETTLEKEGFKSLDTLKKIKPGDRVYKKWKEKMLLAAVAGKNNRSLRLVGSHVDSPRLDLKPNPLYESSGLAMLQTHYYGGIKKYQWMNLPLAMHGVVVLKNGKKITLSIGENEDEPKFIIPDLLPHLSREQMDKKGNKMIEGEHLNIILGNIPIKSSRLKDRVKQNILQILHKKWGIIEEDFNFAEIEFVPAGKPVEIGMDRSLIGAYGQDDRICAFSSLKALIEMKSPEYTGIAFFTDKEETGSHGNTGAGSRILLNFVNDYLILTGSKIKAYRVLEEGKAISADVSPAKNPNFEHVFDSDNISYPGFGVTLNKYNGSRGKYGTNDTHAEYLGEIRQILQKHNIPWQMGEMGKVDAGGGGTIATFLARYGMDCVDAGPCVLGMHSPWEITSKIDLYYAYRLYKSFFES